MSGARDPERERLLNALYEWRESPPDQKLAKQSVFFTLLDELSARTGYSQSEIHVALLKFEYGAFYRQKKKEESIKGIRGIKDPASS